MIFYVVGLCLFGIFDAAELVNNSRLHEKIFFALLFVAALFFGIWYLSEYIKPSLIKIIGDNIELFKY